MRHALILGALLVFAASAARAQNFGGTIGGGTISSASLSAPPRTPPATFASTYAHGDASFSPSAYLPWDEAVALGEPKPQESVADAAREARKEKAEKRAQ